MGFNSAFKGLKLLKKPWERTFKQFKWPRPQCVNMPTYYLTNSQLVWSQLQTWRRRETFSSCRTNLTAVCTVCAAVTLSSHNDLKTAIWLLTDIGAVGRLVYCDMFGTVCCLLPSLSPCTYVYPFIFCSLCWRCSRSVSTSAVLTVFSVCLHIVYHIAAVYLSHCRHLVGVTPGLWSGGDLRFEFYSGYRVTFCNSSYYFQGNSGMVPTSNARQR